MSEIEIQINNEPVEIEIEDVNSQTPEVELQNNTNIIDDIETFALYGPRGPKGDNGDKGDKGDPGSINTYTHTQDVASDVWVIEHNLGKHPNSVMVEDSSGNIIYPPISNANNTTCTIEFIGATTGKAYLM